MAMAENTVTATSRRRTGFCIANYFNGLGAELGRIIRQPPGSNGIMSRTISDPLPNIAKSAGGNPSWLFLANNSMRIVIQYSKCVQNQIARVGQMLHYRDDRAADAASVS